MLKTTFMKRVFREAKYALTSPYGMRFHPLYQEDRMHWGEDYGTYRISVPMYSPVWGRVVRSEWNNARGWFIEIKTTKGYVIMQHLMFRGVRVGQNVNPTVMIGKSGKSGLSDGIHLHIEYHDINHNHQDPAKFISAYTDPVFPKYVVGNLGSATTLNVRSGPSTAYRKVGTLTKGQTVTVYASKNGWSKIHWILPRWVKSEFLIRK